jgi:hypothetical protein
MSALLTEVRKSGLIERYTVRTLLQEYEQPSQSEHLHNINIICQKTTKGTKWLLIKKKWLVLVRFSRTRNGGKQGARYKTGWDVLSLRILVTARWWCALLLEKQS